MTRKASLAETAVRAGGRLVGAEREIRLASLQGSSCLAGRQEALRHRSVIVAVRDQLAAALVLIELDGMASRMVLCPPELRREHLAQVIASARADAWIGDDSSSPEPPRGLGLSLALQAQSRLHPCRVERRACRETEWVLLTSGTTGVPKLVAHTLESLTSAFAGDRPMATPPPIWSTFYDIRRYGGLQILLRALYGGSMVLSSAGEGTAEFLSRAAASGVTHISGTPSHWRKALMSGATHGFSPVYVRLSGEVADQGILDALHAAFPRAVVAHAFASTEAGVGFEVEDGLAGFPASLVGKSERGVEIDVSRGTLRIKSPGNASCYLGENAPPLRSEDGFVDLGDRLELRAGRYFFAGRSGGIINVGGQKVHPEEVEAVINAHPLVQMSRVSARRSPITGAVVTAEVVLADQTRPSGEAGPETDESLCQAILEACRISLPAYKVPAAIRIVRSLEVSASGKLVRPRA
jgi:acyl-coenzyme A synthetase/AMP-(fatty) acid ligase